MKINGLFLLICIIFSSCQDKEKDKEVAVIFLNPDHAGTLKTSDYFDGYRVLTFNDVICNEIADFVEFPDKFLALAEVRHGLSTTVTMYSFNLQGDLLYSVGSLGRGPGEYGSAGNEIILNRDSTVMIFDLSKYLKYTAENELLHEQLYSQGINKSGDLGKPVYLWNDSVMIFFKDLHFYGATSTINKGLKKSIEGADILNIYSIPGEKVVHSYFPCEDVFGYSFHNQFYVFQDTMCFYHEKNGYVYRVSDDHTVPRYKIDKGDYSAETTMEEWMDSHGKSRGIAMESINETDKYVVGIYSFNSRNYYFWFDKKKNETKNFKLIDDDLLRVGIKKSEFSPSLYFTRWHNKIQFPNDYLYFFYTPTRYAKMIEHIKSQLSEKEWEKYKEEHADLIKIYDGLNDDSNTVILGLKFK